MADTQIAVRPEVEKVAKRIREGEIVRLDDFIKEVAPAPAQQAPAPWEALPAELTDGQRIALQRFPEVYGSVVLDERRELTEDESEALLEEKVIVGEVEKLATKRKEDINKLLHAVMDLEVESGRVDGVDPDQAPRAEKGYYAVKHRIPAGNGKAFSREPRKGETVYDPEKLEALAADPSVPEFTHQDYLAMTAQVRVLDELNFMQHLRKRPELVSVLAEHVVETKPPTASIWIRNA